MQQYARRQKQNKLKKLKKKR
jgi:hypothetical protein